MSRLCRLRNFKHGEDGQWAYRKITTLRRELAEARQEIADRKADCETGHDQDEATIAELRQQLKHMTDEYHAALEAEQVRYQQLCTFEAAVRHVTEEGKTKRSFSTSEGWAMVHKDRLTDLEIAEEQLAASQAREQQLREALNQGYGWAPIGSTSKQIMGLALALPQDTAALEAMIAKAGEVMRKRCAVLAAWQADGLAAAVEIRALPAVTLDDLQGGA